MEFKDSLDKEIRFSHEDYYYVYLINCEEEAIKITGNVSKIQKIFC